VPRPSRLPLQAPWRPGLDCLRRVRRSEGPWVYALGYGERTFASVSVMARVSNEEVERRRRSIAMLTTGAPSGLTREEAMEILEELRRCRSFGRRLLGAMQEVRATADRTLRSLSGPEG
jgi:hypothetical protein